MILRDVIFDGSKVTEMLKYSPSDSIKYPDDRSFTFK